MESALGVMELGMGLCLPGEIPVFHQGLHDAMQPVFQILEEEFPRHKLVVTHDTAELIREDTEGLILSERARAMMNDVDMRKFIDELLQAALPVVEQQIKEMKKE